jgi:hypothetical protein
LVPPDPAKALPNAAKALRDIAKKSPRSVKAGTLNIFLMDLFTL